MGKESSIPAGTERGSPEPQQPGSTTSFFEQAVPTPYRIFGVRLLPLSLGRYILLKRFGCAFVAEGPAEATMDDLLLGILICGLRVDEFVTLLENEQRFKQTLRTWSSRIRAEIKVDPHFNLFEKFGLFKAYLEQFNRIPRFWNEVESQAAGATHWSHAIEVTLRSQVGWTLEEVAEAPLSKALADYFQWAHAEGLIRIMTEEEARMNEEAGEQNLKAVLASFAAAGMNPEEIASLKQDLESGELRAEQQG